MTGYPNTEILGRNCRFLQQLPPRTNPSQGEVEKRNPENAMQDINSSARRELRESFERGEEARVKLVNYKKSGEMFVNLLTTIPIAWDDGSGHSGPKKRYVVGFQVNVQSLPGPG
jgi:hypothetical protein